jgi:hypothetical protein
MMELVTTNCYLPKVKKTYLNLIQEQEHIIAIALHPGNILETDLKKEKTKGFYFSDTSFGLPFKRRHPYRHLKKYMKLTKMTASIGLKIYEVLKEGRGSRCFD